MNTNTTTKNSDKFTEVELDTFLESEEYAEYIMNYGTKLCCNGDMLLDLIEDQYLFEEFLGLMK